MNSAPEEWRPIPGWEGLYEASSEGRIQSLDRVIARQHPSGQPFSMRRRGQIMKQITWADSKYLSVTLKNCGITKSSEVQILVCLAFYGPRPTGAHAAHNDGDPSNNRPSNLRWASPVENAADKRLHGTHRAGETAPSSRLTEDLVRQIRRAGGTRTAVAAEFGICVAQVSRIVNRRQWRHLEA